MSPLLASGGELGIRYFQATRAPDASCSTPPWSTRCALILMIKGPSLRMRRLPCRSRPCFRSRTSCLLSRQTQRAASSRCAEWTATHIGGLSATAERTSGQSWMARFPWKTKTWRSRSTTESPMAKPRSGILSTALRLALAEKSGCPSSAPHRLLSVLASLARARLCFFPANWTEISRPWRFPFPTSPGCRSWMSRTRERASRQGKMATTLSRRMRLSPSGFRRSLGCSLTERAWSFAWTARWIFRRRGGPAPWTARTSFP